MSLCMSAKLKRELIDRIKQAITTDTLRIECRYILNSYGYDTYMRLLHTANIELKTTGYKFIEFAAKVIPQSDDKSTSQAIKPGHNED